MQRHVLTAHEEQSTFGDHAALRACDAKLSGQLHILQCGILAQLGPIAKWALPGDCSVIQIDGRHMTVGRLGQRQTAMESRLRAQVTAPLGVDF